MTDLSGIKLCSKLGTLKRSIRNISVQEGWQTAHALACHLSISQIPPLIVLAGGKGNLHSVIIQMN